MDAQHSSSRSLLNNFWALFQVNLIWELNVGWRLGPGVHIFEKPPGDSDAELDLGTTVGNV